LAIGAIIVTCHTAHMARVRCKVGIKCLSCTEKQEGPTLVAQKCGHKFHISLRSKVRRHRDTKHQSGLPNLLLALLVLTASAYSSLGVLQGFEPPTSATNSVSLPEGAEYKDQWERVICPTIQAKYVTKRCNLNNEI
jgi:hypothetical protein